MRPLPPLPLAVLVVLGGIRTLIFGRVFDRVAVVVVVRQFCLDVPDQGFYGENSTCNKFIWTFSLFVCQLVILNDVSVLR